jgi:uncharacterized membrane protein
MSFSGKFKIWQFSKTRLEAFSDAVIAIVMTLLVLELKLPHIANSNNLDEVLDAIVEIAPVYYSWVISFFFVGIMWLHHHNIMHMANKSDYGVVWINMFLLFFICMLPFPTALMGEHPHQPFFVMLWGLTVACTTLMLAWFYYYNTKNYLSDGFNKNTVKKNVRKTLFIPLIYLIASGLAWVSVNISFVIYFFMPLLYILPLDREVGNAGNE